MNLRKVLTEDVLSLNLDGRTKQEIIENLLDILMKTGKVKNRQDALDCLLEREAKMSTGMQNGIAIPHGKTEAVEELIACLGIKKEGVDFQSLDGKPSTIFIMTLSPKNRSGPHIQFLAEVGQLLKEEEIRNKVMNAQSKKEILDCIL